MATSSSFRTTRVKSDSRAGRLASRSRRACIVCVPSTRPSTQSSVPPASRTRADSAIVWGCRLAWLLLAVVGGSAFSDALSGRVTSLSWVAGVALWTLFAACLIALMVASTASLTVVRLLLPLGLATTIIAAFSGATAVHAVVAIALGAIAVITGFSSEFARVFVQTSAYGDETRLPLRLPVPFVLPVVLGWIAAAAPLVVGVLMIGAHEWIIGGVLTIAGAVAARQLRPSFHRFSRRWLVFVPAGVVIHDQLVLAETAMVLNTTILSVGFAEVGSGAADLTGGTTGPRLEIQLAASETFIFAADKHDPQGRAIHATGVMISPSRPGRAIAEAERRTLPIT